MKNDVIKLQSKNILLIVEKTWEKLLHAWCFILGVVARPPRQVDGLGKLNTCLSCVFIAIASQLDLISVCAFM